MAEKELHIVTGAFGYSGSRIAKFLLDKGYAVRTLTNSVNKANPFGNKIEVKHLNFESPEQLTESLRGGEILYNTYWVRFDLDGKTHERATRNTFVLFECAKKAGIKKIVHISITNPSLDSPYGYFRCKARIEQALINSGMPYSILRPAILFGHRDILINNIAWSLRRFPVFPVFGDGNYKIQPIYVDDLANLAVEEAAHNENRIINAIGPETFTYRQLVSKIGELIGKPRSIISVPPSLGILGAKITGWLMNDIMLTTDEVYALMDNLLYVDAPPTGKTRLTEWISTHKDELGIQYASELARRK